MERRRKEKVGQWMHMLVFWLVITGYLLYMVGEAWFGKHAGEMSLLLKIPLTVLTLFATVGGLVVHVMEFILRREDQLRQMRRA